MKVWTIVAGLSFVGCATTQSPDAEDIKNATPAFYTLKEGATIQHKAPLPNLTKIFVNWTYSDGGKSSQEGFRGWDIDRDGNFDMLEALDADGKPYMWAYDFDGNGVIDAVTGGKSTNLKNASSLEDESTTEVAHH